MIQVSHSKWLFFNFWTVIFNTQSEFTIRSAACTLFGCLTKFGRKQSAENFAEQIHTNLPIMLVHLNDDNETVRKVWIFIHTLCVLSWLFLASSLHMDKFTNIFYGALYSLFCTGLSWRHAFSCRSAPSGWFDCCVWSIFWWNVRLRQFYWTDCSDFGTCFTYPGFTTEQCALDVLI